MVALRGPNSSFNNLSHACIGRLGHAPAGVVDVSGGLHSPMSLPQQALVQHLAQGTLNLQPLSNVSLQYVTAQSSPLKHEAAARYNNCVLPSHHYRLLAQTRTECYNPSGGAGAGYMQAGAPAPGAQALRVPSAQPTAPPQQQQDRSSTMSAHNYGPPQTQSQQNRPPYSTYQYRPGQHGSRPATHPRQQQYNIPSAAASSTPPVVYQMFPQPHLVHQPYPQQRSQGFYSYVPSYINPYQNAMPSHTSPYYYASSTQQMSAPNIQGSGPAGRGTASLVGPQGAQAAPASAAMQHATQPPAHHHQNMSGDYHLPQGMHPNTGKRVSHRVPIINPETNQDIFHEINLNDNHYISGESSERQTPQPEAFSVVEEFTRMVSEAANQPTASESMTKSNYLGKNAEQSVTTPPSTGGSMHSCNVANSSASNPMKCDNAAASEAKALAGEVGGEVGETPVVSAITDSPVIVPKVIPNIKQIQKGCEHALALDTNKNITTSKYPKQIKNKPFVPENGDEKTETTENTPSAAIVAEPAAPVMAQAAPAAVQSAPAAVQPAPMAVQPAPAAVQPAPAAVQPAPAAVQPAPAAVQPAPAAVQPAPAAVETAATEVQAAPAAVHAVPEAVQPAPAAVQPAPAEVQPAPAAVQPAPAVTQAAPSIVVAVSAPELARIPALVASVPVHPMVTLSASVSTPVPVPVVAQAHTLTAITDLVPQPPRVRESRERTKQEEKHKHKRKEKETELTVERKTNGPTPTVGTSTTGSQEIICLPTSQTVTTQELPKPITLTATNENPEPNKEESAPTDDVDELKVEPALTLSATELLSASIEAAGIKPTEDTPVIQEVQAELPEPSVASQAQAKLNQSLAGCNRNNLSKMKDINLNNKSTDSDTANGNVITEVIDIDINNQEENNINNNKTGKILKPLDKKAPNKMASGEPSPKENESIENGKNETDTISNVVEQNKTASEDSQSNDLQVQAEKPAYVPKYKYSDDQWSPSNITGKKCYDINFLKQIKDDPLSKNKPESTHMLEALKVMRSTPLQDTSLPFASILRPINDSVLPTFMKNQMGPRNMMRDPKKDSRTLTPGKGSVKLAPPPNMGSGHKGLIHVSISLREDVKLNETENAWKPSRFKSDSADEEQRKTEEVYKKFRGILNKLTPQKFDTLLEKVKKLDIDTQTRLEGVIDLVFEKAIDEPNFSKAYAAMCNKLSKLKVPADNPTTPDQAVNFRNLIISKCQNQFVTNKVDEQVGKLEKDLAECSDPAKKKELQLLLAEENRKVRMRSVGNVRFIGELYKLKMLTGRIMVFCMNYLIDKIEEEKLECLCKLLTTIGQQVESDAKDSVDQIFKKMQDIVERRSNKISSRVRFMIQDVLELRRRNWVAKSVVDTQPKMMDQIQKEAEQHQRNIEMMNAQSPGGGFRRDDGGRGKRGDGRRQPPNAFADNWLNSRSTKYSSAIDTTKLKAAGKNSQDLQNLKLAPHQSVWNQGSGAKTTSQQASSLMSLPTTTNMYSVLENAQADPSTLRANKDQPPGYHTKNASIERSTFISRGQGFGATAGTRTGSMGLPRSNSGNRSMNSPRDSRSASPAPAPRDPTPSVKEVPEEDIKKFVKRIIDDWLDDHDDKAMVEEIKRKFPASQHGAVTMEFLNILVEKSAKDAMQLSKMLQPLMSCNVITSEMFVDALSEILSYAPDLYIDIPMLYENLGYILSSLIEKKYITFNTILKLSESVVTAEQSHILLRHIIKELKSSMGPSFVSAKWQEAGLQLNQWMDNNYVAEFIEENKFEFLEGGDKASENMNKVVLTPAETQSKLLQLMNSEENCECIRGWVQDNLGEACNQDWFMRSLVQAICEYALFGAEGRGAPHFKKDRMSKYTTLINEFGESKQAREANCLVGIQQLIHRLEHPQGLTVDLFQYLHEQYIISVDGFLSWQSSETEPEGKGVMLKALTSFFINIKEADNEDSCSED